jgi:tetratricopeptide (TPR) repeat protein
MSLMIAVVLGGALGGGAMLFFQAYQRQQIRSSSAVLDKMVAEANAMQNAKNYEGAIAKYLEVIKLGPRTEPGKMARTNLATTWNTIGLSAFERKDYRAAADYFGKVIDLYGPDAVYALNQADKTELGNAQYNLSKVWDRTGDRDGAMREWASGRDGRLGSVDPNAPGETDMMTARMERAQKAYNEGNRLFKEGDLAGARAQWTVVLSEAPGTQMAIDAQAALQSTLSNPSFEP